MKARANRDEALVEAELERRRGRPGDSEMAMALRAAIQIEKAKGYY